MDEENTGVGNNNAEIMGKTTGVDDDEPDNLVSDKETQTEEDMYQDAEQIGIRAAHNGHIPKRMPNPVINDQYEYMYALLGDLDSDIAFALIMEQDMEEMLSFVTLHMSDKAGLQQGT